MKKLSLILLLLLASTSVALANGAQFKTSLYLYDADTLGDVTSHTNRILAMLGVAKSDGYSTPIAYTDQRIQGDLIIGKDAFGHQASFNPEVPTPKNAVDYSLNLDGEEIHSLGVFKKYDPSIKLTSVTVFNLSAETVTYPRPAIGLKASAVANLK